jgi:hypothetical protein
MAIVFKGDLSGKTGNSGQSGVFQAPMRDSVPHSVRNDRMQWTRLGIPSSARNDRTPGVVLGARRSGQCPLLLAPNVSKGDLSSRMKRSEMRDPPPVIQDYPGEYFLGIAIPL